MPGTGPVPNPASRRQSVQQSHTWTDLPAEGYQGEVPEWPLSRARKAEAVMWERYWRKPQAKAWAHMGMVDEVALYVRAFLAGSVGDVKSMTEARQWADRLGLTPSALLRNRWRIRADEVAARRDAADDDDPQERLRIVAADAVAGP